MATPIPAASPADAVPPSPGLAIPANFRRLHRSELVRPGDFVLDAQGGVEAWDGPRGFPAAAFLQPIYRLDDSLERAGR